MRVLAKKMKLLNYIKPLGQFTDAYQLIPLDLNPKDRQEKKMLEEAQALVAARIERHLANMAERAAKAGESFDAEAERARITPQVVDGTVYMPLQYVQTYMTRKLAALQSIVSIHNTKEVAELIEVFNEYGVERFSEVKDLKFDYLSWSAKIGQKPKLMVHAKAQDDMPVVIRFEAASELCQKFMNSAMALGLKPGTLFNLAVSAVDPAIEKNKRAGKQVANPGVYVNHNLLITMGNRQHTGHPPQGTRFIQKPTLEQMEKLFHQAKQATSA